MMAEVADMEWGEFQDLSTNDRVGVTIGSIVAGSHAVGSVVPDHDWGYSLVGIDDKFPLALNGLKREPNNGLAFIRFKSSNIGAPAGIRVSGINDAAYNCLEGVGASWLRGFVTGVSSGDWITINRITTGVRSRLYDERMVWSTMNDQTQFDTLKLLCGGNEDSAFSLLVVTGAIDAAKNLRPESWVKSSLPPQDYSGDFCR